MTDARARPLDRGRLNPTALSMWEENVRVPCKPLDGSSNERGGVDARAGRGPWISEGVLCACAAVG